jgi:cyclopropane-fatty-acyl-phospholipid synthase
MRIFAIEHSPASYLADFWLYAGLLAIGCPAVLWLAPPQQRWSLVVVAAVGFFAWSLLEYLLHRFVLHRVLPFKRWHALHHAHPAALVAAPSVLTLALFCFGVWLPLVAALGWSTASAAALGLVGGYFGYAITHHAVHHWPAQGAWLQRQKRWHARHHHAAPGAGVCYGVTSGVWDRLFQTGARQRP